MVNIPDSSLELEISLYFIGAVAAFNLFNGLQGRTLQGVDVKGIRRR